MPDETNTPGPGVFELVLKRDHAIVLGGVVLIVIASIWYTVAGIGMNMSAIDMTLMAGPIGQPMAMGTGGVWTGTHFVLIFAMWWVMMIAMMTPSATPAVLLFIALKRAGPDAGRATGFGLTFLLGYLVAWAVFSLLATSMQWGLQHIGLLNAPMMTIESRLFAGTVLIAAGGYQFSGLKHTCLRHCQSPAMFLSRHARPGFSGAFRAGALHGGFCLGCCWALMALLFVGGIMNLWWITGIAVYVALEKLLPRSVWLAPASGAALIGMGGWLIATSVI